MSRILSGIQPTGELHLGNFLGAVRGWVSSQGGNDAYYCIVDLHALSGEHDPATLAARTLETATCLLAAGLDPLSCTLFVQSQVPEHTRLAWLLECVATLGELGRMTQYKQKAGRGDSIRVGLFTYPVLMAADILLYQADAVPVGEDQRQHLELARNLAIRFNHHYGQTFVVPEAATPPVGARIMDLQEPRRKMSKSVSSPLGTIGVLDEPAEIARKVKKAVTDAGSEVAYDREAKPGVANLLEMLAAAGGGDPAELAGHFGSYGELKSAVAEAISELLRPLRERYGELAGEPGLVMKILAEGAERAGEVAARTYADAARAIGLLPGH